MIIVLRINGTYRNVSSLIRAAKKAARSRGGRFTVAQAGTLARSYVDGFTLKEGKAGVKHE